MQIAQFELFCEVARAKSFSKAAKLMHISQPAISAQIQSMEDYYGIKLFDRTPQGVTLTDAGTVLFDYAKKLLELHDQLEKKLTSMIEERNQKLTIGATPTVGSQALACGIWTFKDKYPDLDINLEIHPINDIVSKLQSQMIDLAIVECPLEDYKGLTSRTIYTDTLVAVAPNSEYWSAQTSVSIQDLLKHRLILPEEGSELHIVLDQALKPLNMNFLDLKPRTVINSPSAVLSAVEKGRGVSICLRLNVQRELRHGTILAVPIDQIDQEVEYQLIYRAESLSSIAKRFIRTVASPDGGLEVC